VRARGAAAVVLALGLVLAISSCARDSGGAADGGAAPAGSLDGPVEPASAGDTEGQVPRGEVRIFFPSADASGLVAEGREIFVTRTPGDRIKQIVADLLSGPTGERALPAVPPGTRLRQAYVVADGVAYLDFSSELTTLSGGSTTEMLTVFAIVDSVIANVPEVRKVGLLVEGAPIETLNGHMDLRRPLPGDWTLVIPASI